MLCAILVFILAVVTFILFRVKSYLKDDYKGKLKGMEDIIGFKNRALEEKERLLEQRDKVVRGLHETIEERNRTVSEILKEKLAPEEKQIVINILEYVLGRARDIGQGTDKP